MKIDLDDPEILSVWKTAFEARREVASWPAWKRGDDVTKETSVLPTDKEARKRMPLARGLLDYFPKALAEVAHVSFVGNEQHNPGEPLHWERSKSTDHADCLVRHLMERGTLDDDGLRHTAKAAWRALALLQTELENEGSR